jgi:hypothetical protein
MSKRSGLADSPFFNPPAAADPAPVSEANDTVPRVPPVRDVRDVRGVLPVRRPKRVLKRHPFDIYADQLESLKDLKAQAMRRGEEASMSRMVREALDQYIERRS